jgi:hypothetical protein
MCAKIYRGGGWERGGEGGEQGGVAGEGIGRYVEDHELPLSSCSVGIAILNVIIIIIILVVVIVSQQSN